jgi:FtsH-binding integral membrane protein
MRKTTLLLLVAVTAYAAVPAAVEWFLHVAPFVAVVLAGIVCVLVADRELRVR